MGEDEEESDLLEGYDRRGQLGSVVWHEKGFVS